MVVNASGSDVIGVVTNVSWGGGVRVGASVTVTGGVGDSGVEVAGMEGGVAVAGGSGVKVGVEAGTGAVSVGCTGAIVAVGGSDVAVGFRVTSVKVAVTSGVGVVGVGITSFVASCGMIAAGDSVAPTAMAPSGVSLLKALKIMPTEAPNSTMPDTIMAILAAMPRSRCCRVIRFPYLRRRLLYSYCW